MKAAALLSMLLFGCIKLLAQPEVLWIRNYSGVNTATCMDVHPIPGGGWILGGYTGTYTGSSRQAWIMKVNSGGDSLTSTTYQFGVNDEIAAMIPAGDGGWICGGTYTSAAHLGKEFQIFRIDSANNVIWEHMFGGTLTEVCHDIIASPEGGFILFGEAYSIAREARHMWVVKTTPRGVFEWQRSYDDGSLASGYSICLAAGGGYILAGTANDSATPENGNDLWLVKIDEDAYVQWTKSFGGPGDDIAYDIQLLPDSGFIVAGVKGESNHWTGRPWLLRLNANGDSLWSASSLGRATGEFRSVSMTPDGGFLASGSCSDSVLRASDFWVVRYDAEGDSLWSDTIGGRGDDVCYVGRAVESGGYLLAGQINLTGEYGRVEMGLVRMDRDTTFPLIAANPDGLDFGNVAVGECAEQQFTVTSIGTADLYIYAAGATDGFSCTFHGPLIIPPGQSRSLSVRFCPAYTSHFGGSLSLVSNVISSSLTITLSGSAISESVSDERRQPVEFGLLDPSPNPFNPATVIRFSLPRAAQTTLTVFDVAGRRVATLTDGLLPAGNHAVHFNGGALPSGLYFCSLRSGPFSATQKLCLVK